MPKLIKDWDELDGLSNDEYRIIVGDYCGWIIPIWDEQMHCEPGDFVCNCEKDSVQYKNYMNHHVYLSTHTFYGSQYEDSTKLLQKYGFDVELDNWDKEK